MIQLKVCGLNNISNINELDKLNIDFLGFIFYKKSKRFFYEEVEKLKNIKSSKIAVFVNSSIEDIFYVVQKGDFFGVQLHGEEDLIFVQELHALIFKNNLKIKIIKAFGIHENFDFSILSGYKMYVDYFLFDTFSENYGGSGNKFNWKLIMNNNISHPFFLSGGIDLNDIDEIKNINNPYLKAVDINSRFETIPGLKNIEKIKLAIQKLKL